MALDLSKEGLAERIDALRTSYASRQTTLREQHAVYLRAYSPPYEKRLKEHDQWNDPFSAADEGHTRSSYNITAAVVDLWTSLEAEFPSCRWLEDYIPTPVPDMDPAKNASAQEVYRARKLVSRQRATIREQTLKQHIRRSKLARHHFRAVRRKNLYGHSWIKTWPDRTRKTFLVKSDIDPSTVYPVWSAWDDSKLDAILVAYRRSAANVASQYPGAVELDKNGVTAVENGYYLPTGGYPTEQDRRFVWVEDYWCLDEKLDDDGGVEDSRVANGVRVNGVMVKREIFEGWRAVPYVKYENEDERDGTGVSDAGRMLPIQDAFNRMLSQQQDVIFGSSRPRFKYRGDADREISLASEEVVSLDLDEDFDQVRVAIDVFPTQVHGTQLNQLMQRVTGLPAVAWGEITSAQNSGRALATAWRATAARLRPRLERDSQSLEELGTMWLDWLELYNWNGEQSVYLGSRDFAWDFPNQEPRDFSETTLDALNRLNGGIVDLQKAMELTGEESPDEMIERVRASYMDTVLHPEKAQSFLLLTRLQGQIQTELDQAKLAMEAQRMQMQQMAAAAPGNAPASGPPQMSPDQQAGLAANAEAQAAATAAPTLPESENMPATQAGAPGNAGEIQRNYGVLMQDGAVMNRVIEKGPLQR